MRQKARTRELLVAALHELMAHEGAPTIEAVAETAGVSRTTAYRYFPDQGALIAAAFPRIDNPRLFETARDETVPERVARVVDFQIDIIGTWAPQLRAALWSSLGAAKVETPLRTGRAIGWFEQALSPLSDPRPGVRAWSADRIHTLALRLRATVGIEPWIWLVEVAGVPTADAATILRDNALAIVQVELQQR